MYDLCPCYRFVNLYETCNSNNLSLFFWAKNWLGSEVSIVYWKLFLLIVQQKQTGQKRLLCFSFILKGNTILKDASRQSNKTEQTITEKKKGAHWMYVNNIYNQIRHFEYQKEHFKLLKSIREVHKAGSI